MESILTFLGFGSCFGTCFGSNSAYLFDEKKSNLLLIDCGESTFSSLREFDMCNVKNIDILITHMHSDHIGSLSSLIYYCEMMLKIVPTIVFPNPKQLSAFLTLQGNSPNSYNIVLPVRYTRYAISAIKQNHSKNMESYGYLITVDDSKIYYSGDSSSIPSSILKMLTNGTIDYFYQDVTKYSGTPHMNINDLQKLIPAEYKDRVFCMHLDDLETYQLVLDADFNIPDDLEDYKSDFNEFDKS